MAGFFERSHRGALGLVIGIIVGGWLNLLGLVGLEILEVDQTSRGTLAPR